MMFCITLQRHFREPKVEVILSVIVSFMYIDVGIEATACAHSADTIRYDTIRYDIYKALVSIDVTCKRSLWIRIRAVVRGTSQIYSV